MPALNSYRPWWYPGEFPVTVVARGGMLALLWWALTEGRPDAWWFGVPVIAIATLASLALNPPQRRCWRLSGLVRFLGFFVTQSLSGGVDVARRALHPRLPLSPGVVDYPLRLPKGLPQVLMTDTVSLLPGTLSAELHRHHIRLHVLDTEQPVRDNLQELEQRIAAVFCITLPQEKHPEDGGE